MQAHITLIKKLFQDPFDSSSINAYGELLSEDVVLHGPLLGQEAKGIEQLKKIDSELSRAFKSITRTINDLLVVNDKVIVYWTVNATYGPGEDEGKKFVVSGHGIYRIKENKICEIWQSWDKIHPTEQTTFTTQQINAESVNSLLKNLRTVSFYRQAALLSRREKECLKIFLQGKTAKETATHLSLSYRTIESYFENIKNKLDCTTKRELLAIAQTLDQFSLLS